MPHKQGTGVIRGIVSEDGFPAQKRVTLLDRTNLRKLATVVSGVDGDYAFSGLDPSTDDYMLFAVDDDREVDTDYKDPIIYDRVQPLNAVMGAAQTNEWFYLAQSKNMRSAFVAMLSSPNGDPNQMSSWTSYGASVWINLGAENPERAGLGGLPVIPHMGSFSSDGDVIASAHKGLKHDLINFSTQTASLEWVIDLDTVSGNPAYYNMVYNSNADANEIISPTFSITGNNNANNLGAASMVGYVSNRRAIVAGYNVYGTSQTTLDMPFSAHLNANGTSGASMEYILPPEITGKVHIVASLAIASSTVMSKLYVNGQMVASRYLTANRPSYTDNNRRWVSILAGSLVANQSAQIRNYSNVRVNTLIASSYDYLFTDADASAHYDALFNTARTPQMPLETGYKYAVKLARPYSYYPLDEGEGIDGLITCVEHCGTGTVLSRVGATTGLAIADESIVLGRSLLKFSGGGLLSAPTTHHLPIGDALTMAWVAAPEAAIPSSVETLYRKFATRASSGSTVIVNTYHFALCRDTSGRWCIESGVSDILTFETLPELNVQHHYAVTIDFAIGEAKLYVDQSLIETVQIWWKAPIPRAHATRTVWNSTVETWSHYIAIGVKHVIVSNNLDFATATSYRGVFGQLSLHPYIMSDRQIEDLHDFLDVM